jgi:AraC family transcriptional regulator of adaptative response/methylated-DNA-[protein]-cysteine methyltransferase
VARCVERARWRLDTEEEAPTLAELAAEAGLSPGHFQRLFKARVGVSPKGYARAVRATRLRTALEEGATVTEAIYGAGYGGPARAHGEAGAALGMSPSAYRKGGAGEVIDYTISDCVLGRVLVAATPRGLCAIFLGDDDAALYDSLRARFPKAEVRAGGDSARAVLPTVQTLAAEPGRPFDGPLDVRGTAFQLKVWDALRRIPPGETRTYGAIADEIGQPTAARAVARACADNPVAMVVPCHRVLRGDGCPGGYRWGTARKLALLKAEQESQVQG